MSCPPQAPRNCNHNIKSVTAALFGVRCAGEFGRDVTIPLLVDIRHPRLTQAKPLKLPLRGELKQTLLDIETRTGSSRQLWTLESRRICGVRKLGHWFEILLYGPDHWESRRRIRLVYIFAQEPMVLHGLDQPFQFAHRDLRLLDEPRQILRFVGHGASNFRETSRRNIQVGHDELQIGY